MTTDEKPNPYASEWLPGYVIIQRRGGYAWQVGIIKDGRGKLRVRLASGRLTMADNPDPGGPPLAAVRQQNKVNVTSPVPFVPGPKDQGLGRPTSLGTVPYGPVRCRRTKGSGQVHRRVGQSCCCCPRETGETGRDERLITIDSPSALSWRSDRKVAR